MITALLITLITGVSIIIGALIARRGGDNEKFERFSIALALGALSALLFFHLGPEVFEHMQDTSWYFQLIFVAVGILILKVLDIFVPDHEDTNENHDAENAEHIGLIAALALILHNIIEGMTVYSISLGNVPQGLSIAIGIALHNIPLGIMIYSTMDGHHRMKKAVVLLVVSMSTLLGGLAMVLISHLMTATVIAALVALSAGMVIYIVFFELVPHVIRTKPITPSLVAVLIGFVIVLVAVLSGGHEHIH